MATDEEIISEAVKGTWAYIKKNDPEDYSKLVADSELKDSITEEARKAAKEEVELSHEFTSQLDIPDIRKRLEKHLTEHRISLIEKGLTIPTFCMEISMTDDGYYLAQFTREGHEFRPPIKLETVAAIDYTSFLQYASIVVEGVLLVAQAAGIEISVSEGTMKATIEETEQAIKNSSKFQEAIKKFISSWNAAEGKRYDQAKALFYLVKDTYAAGLLWTIIKSLCRNMSWRDWLETAAKVIAMVIAAFATEGAALIAEIVLALVSAIDFAKKIVNVGKLEEIKENVSKK